VSFDSWWLGQDISEKFSEMGFYKQVICAKQATQLKVGREKKSVAQHFFDNPLTFAIPKFRQLQPFIS